MATEEECVLALSVFNKLEQNERIIVTPADATAAITHQNGIRLSPFLTP